MARMARLAIQAEVLGSSLATGLKQLREVQFQNVGDTDQGIERWLSDAALDVADHLLGEAGSFSHG